MKSITGHSLRFVARLLLLVLIATGVVQAEIANPVGESKGLVLVAGATGGTGREVVKHLLLNDFSVRALVRNEDSARKLFGDDVTYVVADVRQPDEIIKAMKGTQYVITAIGATRGDKTNSPEFVDYGGVRNLADVAKALDIKQFVLVSSSGVTDEDHFLNKAFNNVLKWKLKGEDALRASGVPYTIVRPGGLVDEPGGQAIIVFSQGDTTSGAITREDVAMVCVAALQYPAAVNKTFETYSETGEYSADWQAMFGSLKAD